MTALVLRSFNGKIHASIDPIGAKSTQPRLGEELDRIPLHPEDAIRSIDTLLMMHQGRYFAALTRIAA